MSQRVTSPEDVGRFYDQFTRFFEITWGDSIHVGYWPAGSQEGTIAEAQVRFTELMMSKLGVRAGEHLLDVGCGTGEPAVRLARTRSCQVTGVTISPKQAEAANQRAHDAGLSERVRFHRANAMALPFPDASFDVAWALESIFHMFDTGLALSELRRTLKPGGRALIADFIVAVPMSPEDEQFHREMMQTGPMHSVPDYQRLIREAGFELEETLDITANMMRTAVLTREALTSKREELRQAFGNELLGMLDATWAKASDLGQKHQGYAVFLVRKP
ncbi:methyltransferase domain-containing protein [Archangium sp.]|uniref:methyltransferase domain-containing protein n=1 Tax=Archangium sp. TaxID=1872627 RepID=UPI003899FC02